MKRELRGLTTLSYHASPIQGFYRPRNTQGLDSWGLWPSLCIILGDMRTVTAFPRLWSESRDTFLVEPEITWPVKHLRALSETCELSEARTQVVEITQVAPTFVRSAPSVWDNLVVGGFEGVGRVAKPRHGMGYVP